LSMEALIEKFKSAGWQGTVYSNIEDALKTQSNGNSFWCAYKGEPRLINLEVCQRHRLKIDPECKRCERSWED